MPGGFCQKHKYVHLLNIIGLSTGLTVALILGAYCVNEYEYDRFNTKVDSIFRLWAKVSFGANSAKTGHFSSQTAEDIGAGYSAVLSFTRIRKQGSAILQNESAFTKRESNIIFSGPSLFSIFTFPAKKGSANALSNPNSIMISESMANRYFGSDDVINRILTYNDSVQLKVDGVFADVPHNSSVNFDFVVSEATLDRLVQPLPGDERFGPCSYEVYLLLDNSTSAETITSRLSKLTTPFNIGNYHFECLQGMHIRDYESGL